MSIPNANLQSTHSGIQFLVQLDQQLLMKLKD